MISQDIVSKKVMKSMIIFLVMMSGLSKLVYITGENARSFYGDGMVPGEILIGLKPEAIPLIFKSVYLKYEIGISSIDILNRKYCVQKIEQLFPDLEPDDYDAITEGLAGIFKLSVPKEIDLLAMIREYTDDPFIEYAEPNLIVELLGGIVPNDPKFKMQWALHNKERDADIDAKEAWEIEIGKKKVLIAITDTGVNYQHEDFTGSYMRTDIDKDFVENDNDAMDDHGHGTHVAGIIAAGTNNDMGIAGICWKCSILPIRILNALGEGSIETAAKGIRYAAKKQAKIINMSWGIRPIYGCSKTIAKAINYAWEKGCLLIAAAGNEYDKELLYYPASSPRVLAVGASTKFDKSAKFSNGGEGLDLVAPGKNILSLWLDNSLYGVASGTSMAAPHVCGVAGLILSNRPRLNAGQTWRILQRSSDDLGPSGWDNVYGWGRVNAYAALTLKPKDEIIPPKDKCKDEPEECPASVTLRSEKEFLSNIGIIRKLRDRILANSELGIRWIQLYYRHNNEVTSMLLLDEDLRSKARYILKIYNSVFRNLIDEYTKVEPVIITNDHIASLYSFMWELANRGSDQLYTDIMFELERWDLFQFIGREVREVWQQIKTIKHN